MKYEDASGYSPEIASACETALVRLMQAFAQHKDHLRLIGGLVPRYLTPEAPPEVPAHVGTTDVDVVLDLHVLVDGRGKYRSLKEQLKRSKFTRVKKENGAVSSWQWQIEVSDEVTIVVEFLQHEEASTSSGQSDGVRLKSIDGEDVSACLIPHVGIVRDWYEEKTVWVTLEDGVCEETIRYADVVSFIALKALAFEQRKERKDAADLIHVMRYWRAPLGHGDQRDLIDLLVHRIEEGKHPEVLRAALRALRRSFCSEQGVPGHLKNGPGAFVNFHGLKGEDAALERREVSGLVEFVLRGVEERLGRDLAVEQPVDAPQESATDTSGAESVAGSPAEQ